MCVGVCLRMWKFIETRYSQWHELVHRMHAPIIAEHDGTYSKE